MAGGRLSILLVDDDQIDVMNVQRALRDSVQVDPLYVASNGLEALTMLRSGAVPRDRLLILLDINMPRMNGIELLRALRGDPELRSLMVVVLTTSNDERDKVEAHRLNVAGYIVKPVTMASFVECMKKIQQYWNLVEFP